MLQVIVAESIIALVGIAIVTAGASLLLVQSAGATTDILTTTTSVGGEQEAASSTTTTNNNVSNAVQGSLFLTGEDKLTSFNRINETYTKVSYVGNRTIMPPEATTATINATVIPKMNFATTTNGTTTANVTIPVCNGGVGGPCLDPNTHTIIP